VFIRGFRISIREGIIEAALRGQLEICSVSDSTSEDIFGSQSGSSPFSPQISPTRTWFSRFGGGHISQTPPLDSNQHAPALFSEDEVLVHDVVLNPILTTSEVALASGICFLY
jgi:hypothetical protein